MSTGTLEKDPVEVINTELVFPSHTNHYGTIFGGRILELMDMTGGLAAMQFSNGEIVTASIDGVDFKVPINQGDIIEFRARLINSGNTSMVVKVEVFRIDKINSKKELVCKGYLIFVAIDADGKTRRVPKLKVSTEEDKKLWEIGEMVRRKRTEMSEKEENITM